MASTMGTNNKGTQTRGLETYELLSDVYIKIVDKHGVEDRQISVSPESGVEIARSHGSPSSKDYWGKFDKIDLINLDKNQYMISFVDSGVREGQITAVKLDDPYHQK
ncbi:MAG: hypothetical protein GOU98_03350, partial [Candidatus Altiarchaeota archaeon]|nr:hypothetical protein [Candidatus Altiarchaeota archaeon]